MRQLTKQIALLERVDQLIRLKATGRPQKLAEKLEVSEATVFRIIETMKELNAPVYYNWSTGSYAYSIRTKFKCGFFVEEIDDETSINLSGGNCFENLTTLIGF